MFHPMALVESEEIGEGTCIWAYAHVMPGARIGANCNIGDHAFVERGAVVGDNVTIKNGVCVWEGVHLGDGVFVGPNAVFTNDLYPRSPRLGAAAARYQDKSWLQPTYVEEGVTIGANATILCGVRLGRYAFIGAGAVVTRDVAPHAMMLGAPARQRGWVCHCGYPLEQRQGIWGCGQCDRTYTADAF
ncbi:MAG TPA: acyltransferase [Chthonomonadaceae bacterium]|nr:acyltransferase [Chthonomonadaceae bacterium]